MTPAAAALGSTAEGGGQWREALLHGRIEARAFLGNYWLFQVATDVGHVQITLPNTGPPESDEGDAVGLAWSPQHARVLPHVEGAQS